MPTWNTTTEKITLKGNNNDDIDAYVARPSEPGSYPGVVVIHHLPGWDAWTREIVRKFADNGFIAISSHLHHRIGAATPEEAGKAAWATWGPSDANAMGDIAACARWIKEQPDSNGKVGDIGFCSGGRQAYLSASQVPEIDAAVDCWGGAVIPDERFPEGDYFMNPFAETKNIRVPLLGIFGNDDKFPTPEVVDQTEEELKKHGKDYEFHRYDGAGHGFWANFTLGYRPEQTNDSFQKVLAFYDKHLK